MGLGAVWLLLARALVFWRRRLRSGTPCPRTGPRVSGRTGRAPPRLASRPRVLRGRRRHRRSRRPPWWGCRGASPRWNWLLHFYAQYGWRRLARDGGAGSCTSWALPRGRRAAGVLPPGRAWRGHVPGARLIPVGWAGHRGCAWAPWPCCHGDRPRG
ncbi:hypothetical protein QJS66_09015 [Kocuria rhizophila]|nr:hypothetical protein QJS66_09015 [Kocuria rhizophila]